MHSLKQMAAALNLPQTASIADRVKKIQQQAFNFHNATTSRQFLLNLLSSGVAQQVTERVLGLELKVASQIKIQQSRSKSIGRKRMPSMQNEAPLPAKARQISPQKMAVFARDSVKRLQKFDSCAIPFESENDRLGQEKAHHQQIRNKSSEFASICKAQREQRKHSFMQRVGKVKQCNQQLRQRLQKLKPRRVSHKQKQQNQKPAQGLSARLRLLRVRHFMQDILGFQSEYLAARQKQLVDLKSKQYNRQCQQSDFSKSASYYRVQEEGQRERQQAQMRRSQRLELLVRARSYAQQLRQLTRSQRKSVDQSRSSPRQIAREELQKMADLRRRSLGDQYLNDNKANSKKELAVKLPHPKAEENTRKKKLRVRLQPQQLFQMQRQRLKGKIERLRLAECDARGLLSYLREDQKIMCREVQLAQQAAGLGLQQSQLLFLSAQAKVLTLKKIIDYPRPGPE